MKRKKIIDPTKPLKNPKHEIMARKLASGKSQVEAYLEAYPKSNPEGANAVAYRAVAMHGINDRALKLLESVGLNEKKLASKLNECVDSEIESIKLDATKHGLKLIGYGQDKEQAQQVYNPVQVIIQQLTVNPQPIDTKEDTKGSNDT